MGQTAADLSNVGLIAPTGPLNHIDLDPLVTFTVGDR